MGLGVSFGAKDEGLIGALTGIEKSLGGIQESLVAMNAMQGAGIAAQEVAAMGSGAAQAGDGFTKLGEEAGDALLGAGDAASQGEVSLRQSFGKIAGTLWKSRVRVKLTGFAFITIGTILKGLTLPITTATKLMLGLASAFSPASFDAGLKKLQEGLNLVNAMESELFSTGVSARQMGAQFGYTGKELNKFESQAASMAYSIDVGVETAARAIRGFTEAEDEMRAVGITSASDLAKFSEAFGVNADTIRNNLMAMARQGGLTDSEIKQVTSSLVQMGQDTGDVTGAMEMLPVLMENIKQQNTLMGDGFQITGAAAAEFAVQTSSLATGFFQMGQKSDEARERASGIAKGMLEAQTSFQNMFAGTESELNSFMKGLKIVGFDSAKTFELMKTGPAGLVKGMTEMVQGMSEKEFAAKSNFIRGQLETAMGPEAAQEMMSFFETADKGVLKAMANVENASESLGELGNEAHKASFNLSDQMDRALQKVNTSLRSIARSDSKKFVRALAKDARHMGQSLRKVAKEGGAVGGALKMISKADQLGGLAFIPASLRSTAVMAEQATGALMKTWESFKAGGGPIGLARNGIAMFATEMVKFKSKGMSWTKAFGKTSGKFSRIFQKMIKKAGRFLSNFAKSFAEMNWEEMINGKGAKGPKKAWANLVKAFESVKWDKIWENVMEGMGKLSAALQPHIDKFRFWLEEQFSTFWEKHGESIKSAFLKGFIGLFSIAALIPILWGMFTALGSALVASFVPWIIGILWAGLTAVLGAVGTFITGTLIPGVLGLLGSIATAILAAVSAPIWVIVGVIAAVVAAGVAIWYFFGDEIKAFANDLWNSVTWVFEKIGDFFSDLFGDQVTQTFKDLGRSISWVFDEIKKYADKLLGGAFGKVWDFFTGGSEDVDKLSEKLDKTTQAAKGAMGELGKLDAHETTRRRTQFSYVRADPKLEAQRQKQLAGMSEELQAIHDPMWWSGAGGYREMFDRRMQQLIQATSAQTGATPTGTTTERNGKPPPKGSSGSRAAGSSRGRSAVST